MLIAIGLAGPTPDPPSAFSKWTIAYVQHGDVCISRGDGRYRRTLAKGGSMPTWSPTKSHIAFARGNEVWVVDRAGKNQRRIYTPKEKDGGLGGIGWGTGLAPSRVWAPGQLAKETPRESILIADNSDVHHVPVTNDGFGSTERFEPIDPPMDATLFSPAIARDGRHVAISVEGDVWLAWTDPARLKEENMRRNNGGSEGWEFTRIAAMAEYDMPSYRVSRENNYVRELDWAPDGKALACGFHRMGGSGLAQIILLRFGSSQSPYERFFRGVRKTVVAKDAVEPDFSPDGRWILCKSAWGSSGLLAISADGRTRHSLILDADQGDW